MKPTLVILAAGVGSRFGGLKQLVLVVRQETESLFRNHLEEGISSRCEVVLVHQELDSLPAGFAMPETRRKPWGTGHAVLVAVPVVDGPFAVANADDYYGRDGLAAIARFLNDDRPRSTAIEQWAMVGYRLGNTLPGVGSVSRGLCQKGDNENLIGLREVLKISRHGDVARWTDEAGVQRLQPLETLVSMNLWGFSRSFMSHLERGFEEFLAAGPSDTTEYLLPDVVSRAIADGSARVRVLTSDSEWFGMTSPEDRDVVRARLAEKVDAGEYPHFLWHD